jgi:branched-chain amino acid transport system permease protein
MLIMDRLVYRHYRRIKIKQSIVGITASIGVMFITGGIVRFVLGASAQRFGDGERFIFLSENLRHLLDLSKELHSKHLNF